VQRTASASAVTRTRRELAAAVALYLFDHTDEYDHERDELALPADFARNAEERAIIESLDRSEIEGATALACTRAARNARSCSVAQDLHNFAAGCLERMHARLPHFDELRELAEAERVDSLGGTAHAVHRRAPFTGDRLRTPAPPGAAAQDVRAHRAPDDQTTLIR
jgi:hypothetical protein